MASADELLYLSAADQARRIAARELSAVEICDAYLAQIDRVDGQIGAYLTVTGEQARTRAAEIDDAIGRGDDVGPLAGVPIALKDILVTKDVTTTAGSKILDGWIPPYDGTAVRRLHDAGAVMLGKLNMDEFAMGSSNENSAFKVCRNPWDVTRVPGGSSGGSAAAVAAGMCAASLGTDTGGSIRQPAALCGTVGIKPTYGRVSRYGVIAFASSLDQVGPLTRTVEDAALVLESLCGFDPLDATSIEQDVPRYRDGLDKGVAGLTIGLAAEYFADGTDPEITAAVRLAVEVLERAGAKVAEVSLPHTSHALAAYYIIAPAEASSNLARYDGVRYGVRVPAGSTSEASLLDMYRQSRGSGFGAEVKRRIMLGTYALRSGYYDAYYRKAQQIRALIKRDFDQAFAKVDVLLSPTSPTPAFPIGAKTDDPLAMYLADVFTLSCNLAGLPGMSVPCGQTTAGLPIGMQLLGRPLDEMTLLQVAACYEREAGLPVTRPELP